MSDSKGWLNVKDFNNFKIKYKGIIEKNNVWEQEKFNWGFDANKILHLKPAMSSDTVRAVASVGPGGPAPW